MERRDFLDELRREIYRLEDQFDEGEDRAQLHRALLHFSAQYVVKGRVGAGNGDLVDIPTGIRQVAFQFFLESVVPKIKAFGRSDNEAASLLAKLMEWHASEVAKLYHRALETEQSEDPQKIFHAERATDEVESK